MSLPARPPPRSDSRTAATREASVIKHLTEVGDDLNPMDAAVAALTRGGLELAQYADSAGGRQDLIASSPELQEHALIKMASLARYG
jgi:hypothetical protein